MSREWKPGPAMIRQGDREGNFGAWEVGFYDGYNGEWVGQRKGRLSHSGLWVIDARPLVVIDPDSPEQVERLLVTLLRQNDPLHPDGSGIAAALREIADPKPPKCPAALIIKGEHFACDQPAGHGMSHSNIAAGAIWGEVE